MHNAFNLEIPGLHKLIGHDIDVLALLKRDARPVDKLIINQAYGMGVRGQEVGRVMRPDGGVQFDRPVFEMFPWPIDKTKKIRILPDIHVGWWHEVENGPVINPVFPALRLKQLKNREPNNSPFEYMKACDFKPGYKVKAPIVIATEFDKLVDDARKVIRVRKDGRDGLKRLQALWKAAQDPKPGIGHGHPAFKGMFPGKPPEAYQRGYEIERNVYDGPSWLDRVEAQERKDRAEAEARWARRELERVEERRVEICKASQYVEERRELVDEHFAAFDKKGSDKCFIIALVYDAIFDAPTGRCRNEYKKLISSRMDDRGFTEVGEGSFSRVWKDADDNIYKASINDDSADPWYAWAVNCAYYGSQLESVPRIDHIRYYGRVFCARMEKLVPLTRDEMLDRDKFHCAFGSDKPNDVMKLFNINKFDAIEFMSIVDRTQRETGSNYDMHGYNLMYRIRPDGTKALVLTDPLAFGTCNMADYDVRLKQCNFNANPVPQLAKAA